MSLKHLGPGSECPPFTGEKLRVYSMVFCPFAQRARLVLEAKNIPYEVVNIYLKKKPEWYASINPSTQVPCLQLKDGRFLTESLVISEYLDAEYPENKLIPSDPYTNARHKLTIEDFTKVIPSYYKLALKSDLNAQNEFNSALVTFINNNLHDEFFGGKTPAFVDYMVWPWLERVEFLKQFRKVVIDSSISDKLEGYIQRMLKQPAAKKLMNSPDKHDKFYETTVNPALEQECDHGI